MQLDAAGARAILRCPLIPGINADDTHLEGIARIANSLVHVTEITLHPYHLLGKSKSERIGAHYPLPHNDFAEAHAVELWLSVIADRTRVPVRNNR